MSKLIIILINTNQEKKMNESIENDQNWMDEYYNNVRLGLKGKIIIKHG